MTKKRAIVAITGPDRGGFPAWFLTALAVRRAGGKPLRLRPGKHAEAAELPKFEALIIGGGADIAPERARIPLRELFPKQDPQDRGKGRRIGWLLAPFFLILRRIFAVKHSGLDPARDAFEERCLKQALEKNLPVLGICRGAQFINVHFGGSLHAELSGFYGEHGNPDSVYPRKRVHLQSDTLLRSLLNRDSLKVNSFHRQAVDQLGEGVKVSAQDEAKVIQAIEVENHPFIIGVQWHPEYLPTLNSQQRLFRSLIAATG
ncbi:MAG: gamma-glutamyl-gamma-aminobutyrate hydrolase family protein [Opitutales bacterium]|nr:gamma-glutamyl-gamma-aminobutyrate hydrolase family protein [Opitutales bacterium]